MPPPCFAFAGPRAQTEPQIPPPCVALRRRLGDHFILVFIAVFTTSSILLFLLVVTKQCFWSRCLICTRTSASVKQNPVCRVCVPVQLVTARALAFRRGGKIDKNFHSLLQRLALHPRVKFQHICTHVIELCIFALATTQNYGITHTR